MGVQRLQKSRFGTGHRGVGDIASLQNDLSSLESALLIYRPLTGKVPASWLEKS